MTETTRRTLLGAAAAFAAAPALAQPQPPAPTQHHVPFSSGTEVPKLRVPAFATDCHFHIYNNRFPPAPGGLPAPNATPAEYRLLQRRLGTTRGVIVQPSLYGTDNSATLDALATLGRDFRAVAVVNTSVTDAELQRLHGLGVRGIRFNLVQAGATNIDMLETLSARVSPLGWHCQIHLLGDKIVEAQDLFLRIPGKLVFDHLARVPEPAGVNSDAFKLVRRLLDKGNTWVKLSGAYQDTKVGPPTYADSTVVAKAYAAAAPNRVVWGSDWPHPTEPADRKPDDAVLIDLLSLWIPDEPARHRALVQNPAELYDFPVV